MQASLRVKLGSIEVEYQGTDDFLRKDLPGLLKLVVELRGSGDAEEATDPNAGDAGKAKMQSPNRKLSSSTAAAKLAASSGSELAIAAAAALTIGEGKESFSRAELLKSMKAAKAHFKASYGSNLSNALSTLIKSQELLDQGGNSYALSASKRKQLESVFAS